MDDSGRTDPPRDGDEAATLLGFLDYQRDTLRWKTRGLSQEQLDTALAPSDMTLGGMLKHLALVEHSWLTMTFLGKGYAEPWASVDWRADEDWDWHSAAQDTPEDLHALLDTSAAATDRIVAAADGLGQPSVRTGPAGETTSLRWILVHLVEEYARHNGHADLIRQSIDGATGE